MTPVLRNPTCAILLQGAPGRELVSRSISDLDNPCPESIPVHQILAEINLPDSKNNNKSEAGPRYIALKKECLCVCW